MTAMLPKPVYQKKIGTGITLSFELLNRLDQFRGDVPRSRMVENILRQHLNLPVSGQGVSDKP
jgi:hypothetical protein